MITLHFDGSCLPTNPGYYGGAAAVIKNGKFSKKLSKRIQSDFLISSNLTEYQALILGLEYLLEHNLQDEKIEVYGDSRLVINQCSGLWQINQNTIYGETAFKCRDLIGQFTAIVFNWIPREQNWEADALTRIDCESAHSIKSVNWIDREYQLVCS